MKKNKSSEILESAIDIILDRGPSAFTLRGLSRKAGVSLGVINYHFLSKGTLYKKLIAYISEKLLGFSSFKTDERKDINENMRMFLKRINDLFVEHGREVRSFLVLKIHAQTYPTYQPYFNDIENRVEKCLSDIANLDNSYSIEMLKYKFWSAVFYSFLVLNEKIKLEYMGF
jgi:AcrR family transcriptional regulator